MHAHQTLDAQRVAIYARFSSERQRETSIDDQVRRCRTYIDQKGGNASLATVFSDYAISGSSLDRPGFESLMRAVDEKRVDCIVTEDISRIIRDFADSAHVFRKLQFAQIPLIGVADGIDTSSRDAKLSFTLKSLVADIYIDDLRDKTLRGLEGRARAGYATGNAPYGYRSVAEKDARRNVIGHRVEIDPERAPIVRRIFESCRDGDSQPGIARKLNQDGILSPRVGTRHKHTGWGSSTIRAMLHNERYIGIWKFKQRQWVKVPGTNKRRPRKRDDSEVIVTERPELRIIDQQLWDAVQRRLQATRRKYTRGKKKMGRPRNGGSRYLLSSLLYCGQCDAPMTITAGSSAAYYRCSLHRKKGTCDNALSIREDVARAHIIGRVRDMLMSREILEYIIETTNRKLAAMSQRFRQDLDDSRRRLAKMESRIESLVELLADGERSDYVRRTLRDLESQAKGEKRTIADLEARTRAQTAELPSVEQVIGAFLDMNATLQTDVAAGRERLRQLFKDGKISLIPDGDCYVAKAQISPFAPLVMPPRMPEKTKPRESNDFAWFRGGSGGPICRLDHVESIRISELINNINRLQMSGESRYSS